MPGAMSDHDLELNIYIECGVYRCGSEEAGLPWSWRGAWLLEQGHQRLRSVRRRCTHVQVKCGLGAPQLCMQLVH